MASYYLQDSLESCQMLILDCLTSKRLEMRQMRVISTAGVLEVRQGDYYEADGRL